MCATATICPNKVEDVPGYTRYKRFCHKQHEESVASPYPGQGFPKYPPSEPQCSTYNTDYGEL